MARIKKLFRFEQASSLLMLAAIVMAFVVANSALVPLYNLVHHMPVHVRFGPLVIEKPLVLWINEGLMVLFFLVVGLEMKREFLEGHLSTPSRVALPAVAALGGMIVPAAIYAWITWDDPVLIKGWAIPTATDIVLALGILSFLGRRVPTSLKVFLTALAIFDDIGAVLIIGLFYGEGLAPIPLLLALGAVAALMVLNAFRVTRAVPYVALGLVLWVSMLKSGIEASLAGILIALAVPMRAKCRSLSPLRATERRLHSWVVLVIVPVFAFFNSGISLGAASVSSLVSPVSFGIVLGLFIGKQAGVLGAVWLAVRAGLAHLPDKANWAQIYGIALLAGIGFTMSLFITSLAYSNPQVAVAAKVAILAGSAASAAAGLGVLFLSTDNKKIEASALRRESS